LQSELFFFFFFLYLFVVGVFFLFVYSARDNTQGPLLIEAFVACRYVFFREILFFFFKPSRKNINRTMKGQKREKGESIPEGEGGRGIEETKRGKAERKKKF
jgi:hypothetical protein